VDSNIAGFEFSEMAQGGFNIIEELAIKRDSVIKGDVQF